MTTQCPKEIAAAMFAVQQKVRRLVVDSSNDFQNYKYVSIDAYYENVRPWLNEAGLLIIPNETDAQVSPDGKTLKVSFDFIIVHESGATWETPIRRTVYIPYGGAQACGSALSYAEKFILRTLFKIPTGEFDPASQEPAPREVEATARQTHDADANPRQKAGQEPIISFDYDDAPYRIFSNAKTVLKSFTDLRTWGTAMKAEVGKKPSLKKLEQNQKEIARIRSLVDLDKGMTAKAKANMLAAIDSIVGEKDESKS